MHRMMNDDENKQIVISARRARLEGRRVPEEQHQPNNVQDGERQPKAPPQGITVPPSKASTARLPQPMTLQQLRDKVQREEDRVQRAQEGGYYVAPPPPQHYRDKDRLQRYDEEELQRQAAQQQIPDKRVVQVQEVHVQQQDEAREVQQVDSGSATTSSTSQSERHAQSPDDSETHY
eukprot:1598716-Amphidinium_carterae.1